MTSFKINLAEIIIEIHALYSSSKDFCSDYLCEGEAVFQIDITHADISYEAECARATNDQEYSPPYLETLAIYRKIATTLPTYGVFLFHGSAVVADGKTIVFTAPSGTGKTTHSRLWLKKIKGSYILNGDKPLIKVSEQGVYVCGTPWQGKECYGCNEILPLHAICIIEQNRQNQIDEIPSIAALPVLLQQTFKPEIIETHKQTLALIQALSGRVRFYRLKCNTKKEAATVAYHKMMKETGQKNV